MTRINLLLIFLLSVFTTKLTANTFDWYFIKNNGQFQSKVKFQHAIPNGNLFLQNDRLTYHLLDQTKAFETVENKDITAKIQHHAFEAVFLGANSDVTISKNKQSSHYFNYFLGNNENNWATNVYGYETVSYDELYNGVDLKMYHHNNSIKYDFIVKPNANHEQIQISYNGLNDIFIDQDGKLHLVNDINEIIEDKPYVYQLIDGQKIEIQSSYSLSNNTITYNFPNGYDKNHELIIDPTLIFSTYSGSLAVFSANASTYDLNNNFYVGGACLNIGFPTTIGAFQQVYAGTSVIDAIQKFDVAGNMLYATYLGGDKDHALDITINNNNELVVLSNTQGTFPITAATAFSPILNGGVDYAVSILSTNGDNLLASTYLGGTGDEGTNSYDFVSAGLLVDPANNVYITGLTTSLDYPVSAGAIQGANNGGFDGVVTSLNSNLSTLNFSTYIGGTSNDNVNSIDIASDGTLFIVGNTGSNDFPTTPGALFGAPIGLRDGFVANINANGTTLISSTYLGTGNDDRAKFIDINSADEIYVGGSTKGAYPLSGGVYSSPSVNNLFIDKLSKNLAVSILSTSIGCLNTTATVNSEIYMTAFGIDYCENIYFTAASSGNDFPTTPDAVFSAQKGLYMCVLEPDAINLKYGSYFGGDINGQHFHPGTKAKYNNVGVLYHTECTQSTDYTILNGTPTQNLVNQDGASFIFDFEFDQPITQIDLGLDMNSCDPTVTLDAADIKNQNVDYLWTTGGEIVSSIDVSSDGNYEVTVSNSCEAVTDDINLTFSDIQSEFDFSNATCVGDTVFFIDNTANTSITTTWTWDFGDGVTSILQNTNHVYVAGGDYTARLTVADNGCDNTKSEIITVSNKPIANFDFSPSFLTAEDRDITFTNTSSSNLPIESFQWNFGAEFGETFEENPIHTFTEGSERDYNVTLRVTDIQKCYDEIVKTVEFQGEVLFYVPNAFTPGSVSSAVADNNQTFKPVITSGIDPYEYHFTLFNKYGAIVFESYNYEIGWNGTYDGEEHINDGVYIWKIDFRESISDNKQVQAGHVVVLR